MKPWRHLARAVDRTLASSPLQYWFEHVSRTRLTVLTYHAVDDADGFRIQMEYVARTRQPISALELLEALDGRRSLPERATLVTFDDGYRTVYDAGLPILERLGIPAVLFVVSGVVDTEQPFWWDEVRTLLEAGATLPHLPQQAPAAIRALKACSDDRRRELIEHLRAQTSQGARSVPQLRTEELRDLERRGVTIGNHTHTHPCLDRCSDARLASELNDAHEALSAMLGHPPALFAYPNGNWDQRAETLLQRLGYEGAFVFDHKVARAEPDHPLRISRVSVDTGTPFDRFRIILSGLHPALHDVRRRGGAISHGARELVERRRLKGEAQRARLRIR